MPKPLTRPPRKSRTTQEHLSKHHIRFVRDQFRETNDPIELMWAFYMAVQAGWYPPSSIVRAVSNLFKRVLDAKGRLSLDLAFGLKRKGKGNWTAFGEQKKRGEQFWIALRMHDLIANGSSIERAAEKVNIELETMPGMKPYKDLAQQYIKTWKKRFARELARLPLP
jgi:hypothetical protein